MDGSIRILREGEVPIRFDGDGLLPAAILAESVDGWGNLFRRVPRVIEQRYPSFHSVELYPFVISVDPGSKILRFAYRLAFKDAAAADKFEEDMAAYLELGKDAFWENLHNVNKTNLIIAAILGGVATLGFQKLMPSMSGAEQNLISDSSSAIINNGSIYIASDPRELVDMVTKATKDPAKVTKKTLSAFRPAGALQGQVSIGPSDANLVIPEGAARLVANTSYDDLKPAIDIRKHVKTPVSIRALDLDSRTTGWKAILPDISGEKRVRVTLAGNVKIKEAKTFFADVEVEVEVNVDGKEKVKSVTIFAVYDDNDQSRLFMNEHGVQGIEGEQNIRPQLGEGRDQDV